MKKERTPNFLVGILIGTLGVLLFWYWQKSTSAEDGALDLLDRYSAARTRLRNLETKSNAAVNEDETAPVEVSEANSETNNLQLIEGIGPTYAGRLEDAGITTFTQLAAMTPDHLREIARLPMSRTAEAADWIGVARLLAE